MQHHRTLPSGAARSAAGALSGGATSRRTPWKRAATSAFHAFLLPARAADGAWFQVKARGWLCSTTQRLQCNSRRSKLEGWCRRRVLAWVGDQSEHHSFPSLTRWKAVQVFAPKVLAGVSRAAAVQASPLPPLPDPSPASRSPKRLPKPWWGCHRASLRRLASCANSTVRATPPGLQCSMYLLPAPPGPPPLCYRTLPWLFEIDGRCPSLRAPKRPPARSIAPSEVPRPFPRPPPPRADWPLPPAGGGWLAACPACPASSRAAPPGGAGGRPVSSWSPKSPLSLWSRH